ncbi:MAG TPA: universal stress protein [Kofleriaceae bacterium]|nr:universal stress protein [Kofleriaceae bacterium]
MLIAHATDLSGDDGPAFMHAASLASTSRARLITLYAGSDGAARGPDVTEVAARWGRSIMHEFRRVDREDDIADAIVESLRALRPELVVVGTHARHGIAALLHASVAEAIARNLDVPVLIVPNRAAGFVDGAGLLDVQRILVPAGSGKEAQAGIAAAKQLMALTGSSPPIDILHRGAIEPELANIGARIVRIEGVLEDAIVEAAKIAQPCIIVMPTHGHDGINDIVLGSHTERVIRDAGCPVLAVPL